MSHPPAEPDNGPPRDATGSTPARRPGRWLRGIWSLFHVLVAGAMLAAIVLVLQQRADAVAPVERMEPVRVVVDVARREDGYDTLRRFSGRIEAVRRTAVSAEAGGRVTRILVREGQRVSRGDIIARLDTRSLRAQRGELVARRRTMEKDRDLARLNADRQQMLRNKGFTSDQAWDAARIQLESAESALSQLDASIRTTNVAINKAVVRAPFDGTVGARLVDEGTTLAAGSPIVQLFDAQSTQVRVGVPPALAATLTAEQAYQLETDHGLVNATLVQVRPDLNETTRTVAAIFTVASADLPRYGQLVQLVIPTRHAVAGFWLPLSALKSGQRGLWDVLVIRQQGQQSVVAHESVEVIHSDGKRVYVRGTLPNGATYIQDGVHRVTTGQQVVPVTAAAGAGDDDRG